MKQLLILFITVFSMAQINRVEPPFWWSDMYHNEIEVIFYGKNIADYQVTISDNIPINKIQKTSNPNYLFVTIDLSQCDPKTLMFTFKNKKKTLKQAFEVKQRRLQSRERKSFDSSDVIYLIMPDRFANGNPNNDSHPEVTEQPDRTKINGRYGGDIEGIIKNLDYLDDLGITAIWSTPMNEDNDERGSYHGYGQSDVYKIDPRLGTNDDYLKLSEELHQRGMKLIQDYVTNHWSYNHWMMHDLPTDDWFNPYQQTSYKTSTQFDPNVSTIDKTNALDGWFVKSMPDLNQKNPHVSKYLIQNAIWWIEYANLDGLRVDTYPYADKHFMALWTKAITDEYPNLNISAEAWLYSHAQIAYWQKDSKVAAIQDYNSYCPNVMDFMLYQLFEQKLLNETSQTWDGGLNKLYGHFTNDFLYPDINNILVFLENHDTQRFNFLYEDIKDYKIALSLLSTIRGIPQLYYGTEIGMTGSKDKGDGDIRREFPGGWSDHPQSAFRKETRTPEQEQYHAITKKLLQWRKTKSCIHNGKTTHYLPQNNVYVYFRHNEHQSIMVIINNSLEKQTIDANRFAENVLSFTKGKDLFSQQEYSTYFGEAVTSTITIEPKDVLILELE